MIIPYPDPQPTYSKDPDPQHCDDKKEKLIFSSDGDPWHFCADPDPYL